MSYDEFYQKGDFVHFKQDRIYMDFLCSFLQSPRNRFVLNVGCGRGYWSELFFKCGVGNIVGLDLSLTGLNIACINAPDVEFILADANSLPFKNEIMDMVFCHGLSDYNTCNISNILGLGFELLRCVKDKGLFVFAYITNFSGKRKGGWIYHKPQSIRNYLTSLNYPIEAIYFIDRLIFLRLFGRSVFNKIFSKYIIPVICHLTKLPQCMVCVVRKKWAIVSTINIFIIHPRVFVVSLG